MMAHIPFISGIRVSILATLEVQGDEDEPLHRRIKTAVVSPTNWMKSRR